MANNNKDRITQSLTTRVTRRQMVKAGGLAALGLAFSKPIVETLYPKPVSAQVSPVGMPGGGGQDFSEVLPIPTQFATIDERFPTDAIFNDGFIKTGNDDFDMKLRGLIQFDVSPWIGGTLTMAKLFLTNVGHDTLPAGSPIPHTVHRMTDSWIGSPSGTLSPLADATWADHSVVSTDFTVDVTDPSTVVSTSFTEYSWDVISIVQLWLNGTPNHGFTLIGDETMMFLDTFVGDNGGVLPFPSARLEIAGTI